MKETNMGVIDTYVALASEADKMIRERWSDAYEILFSGEDFGYVVAAPFDESDGGDPRQPTAVYVGDVDEFDTAEALYERAVSFTHNVDALVEKLRYQYDD